MSIIELTRLDILPHRSIQVFSARFVDIRSLLGKLFMGSPILVLLLEIFCDELLKKKVQIVDMSNYIINPY